jgi:type II secretory pathway component PulM
MGLMATTHAPVTARESLAHWWQVRSRAERRALSAFAALVALALVWLLIWQPIVRDSDRLAQRVAADRAALVEARRAADEIAGLTRAAPAIPAADPRAALEAVLAAKNLRSAVAQIERIDNDRLRVTFDTIDFDSLAATLDALQREAHLRATEVVATARVEPGLVRADVTLTR